MIYLDNAATTRVLPEVFEEMRPYFCEEYGNPSAVYGFAGEAKDVVEKARRRAAALIGAEPREIYFTAGGSESDNWALKAVAESMRKKGRHIITTKIEHHAILHTAEWLEKQGCEVTYLDVNEKGTVNPEDVRAAIRPDTILISVMTANNEIGTIEPIAEIGQIAHEHGILFHTDAVQAFGHIPIDVNAMHIDLLSASGHKLHGPKGIGLMYIRRKTEIGSFIHGGSQERGRRAGTLNVPGIVGLGKACEIAQSHMEEWAASETALRDHFIRRIEETIPHCFLNGERTRRLPNNINFCFRFVEGETMLIMLDSRGICCSSGSACTSGSIDPSHVLLALGLDHETAHGSLRVTLSESTTQEELDQTADELEKIVARLRSMSPAWADYCREQGE